jgi:hypothetical protein
MKGQEMDCNLILYISRENSEAVSVSANKKEKFSWQIRY